MAGVRMDKWLWAARFFKTRSLAARACELGRIQSDKQLVKPAREVRVGDILQIRTEGGDLEVEVLLRSEVRCPASVARSRYRDTASSGDLRRKIAAQRRRGMNFMPVPHSKPSTRDRRH